MQKLLSTLTTIFAAFVFSSLVYLIVGFTLSRSAWHPVIVSSNLRQILFWVLMLISLALLFVVSKLKQIFFTENMPHPENLAQLQRYLYSRFIVLYALAELPAILGLIFFMLSGSSFHLLMLCLLSLIIFVIARPSQETLADLQHRFPFFQ